MSPIAYNPNASRHNAHIARVRQELGLPVRKIEQAKKEAIGHIRAGVFFAVFVFGACLALSFAGVI